MKGARTRSGSLQTSILDYATQDGRLVTLVGMVHVAAPRFYQTVEALIDSRPHHQVQYEATLPPPAGTVMTDAERDLLSRLKHIHPAPLLADLLGLEMQHDKHLPRRPEWVNTDIDMLTLIRDMPNAEHLVASMESIEHALNAATEQEKRIAGRVVGVVMRYLPRLAPLIRLWEWCSRQRRGERRTILDKRNAVAVAAILTSRHDVIALWGVAHLAGIDRALRRAGCAPTGERWVTALTRADMKVADPIRGYGPSAAAHEGAGRGSAGGGDMSEHTLSKAAAELRRQAVLRFRAHGVNDVRGATLWNAGCHIDPDDGDVFDTRSTGDK